MFDDIYEVYAKYLILGSTGYGKSTTSNTLIGDDLFTIGNDVKRITESVKISKGNSRVIIDSPGFADPNDEEIFLTEILKVKKEILELAPIKIIFIVKFDVNESKGFLKASQELLKYFGNEVLKSVLILFIQGNQKKIHARDDFIKIISESEGYNYLKKANDNEEIQYCLWDNYKPFKNQSENFENYAKKLEPISRLKLVYSFDLMKNEKLNRGDLKKKVINEELQNKREFLDKLNQTKCFLDDKSNFENEDKLKYFKEETFRWTESYRSRIDELEKLSIM